MVNNKSRTEFNASLIVYDVSKKRIKIYDPAPSVKDKTYDLVKLIDEETLPNNPNTTCYTESMIDQDGNKVTGIIFSTKEGITGVTIYDGENTYTYSGLPIK